MDHPGHAGLLGHPSDRRRRDAVLGGDLERGIDELAAALVEGHPGVHRTMRQLDGCPSQASTWTTVQLRMIPMTTWTNWAETTTAHLAGIAQPTTVDELAAAVSAAAHDGLRVKPIGAGHSFTSIGQTTGIQIRLDNFAGVVRADVPSGLVTVLAGTRCAS